jgi:imidazolonepropionase-like amidohydrolase
MRIGPVVLAALLVPSVALAQKANPLKDFITIDAPTVALTHVEVIDGTGAPPRLDQTVVLAGGKIQAVGDAARVKVPAGAHVLALAGATVLPGLVGMHDHLYMTAARPFARAEVRQQSLVFPRLYLASGVTTIRTTGSIEPAADLSIKRLVDAGEEPGPRIFATAPYLEGPDSQFLQMQPLGSPAEARAAVNHFADVGFTSFKAYMHIGRAELTAAIAAAHARGLKVTGHLCTIGFHDAIAAGIDNVEHGFLYDSDFFPGRVGDACPPGDKFDEAFAKLDVTSRAVQDAFAELIAHHVAVTSTLAVFEMVYRNDVPERALDLLTPDARTAALASKVRLLGRTDIRDAVRAAVKKDMELERAFVRTGGTLLAGCDPTGPGGVLAGLADQRELELLVEAGFTPVEAIHIATQNGAEFLGEGARLGTVVAGKLADLVVVRGDPGKAIEDVEKVELVFKEGVGYDPAKLMESVRGKVGR